MDIELEKKYQLGAIDSKLHAIGRLQGFIADEMLGAPIMYFFVKKYMDDIAQPYEWINVKSKDWEKIKYWKRLTPELQEAIIDLTRKELSVKMAFRKYHRLIETESKKEGMF